MGLRYFVQMCIQFKNRYLLREMYEMKYYLRRMSNSMDVMARTMELYSANGQPSLQTVDVDEGFRFIGSSKDECIIPQMRDEKLVWAYNEMNYLIDNIFDDTIKNGVMLDIGANIGTTSVYFAKKTGMKVIAFEPDKDNYIMLKSNCILNQVENLVCCEKIALSNINGQQLFEYDAANPGKSKLINEEKDTDNINIIKVMRLDDYIQQKEIDIEKISFIWMDVEGFEAEAIDGAMVFLRKNPVPMFVEVNWKDYIKKGILDSYIDNITNVYTHFMDVGKNDKKWLPISKIKSSIYNLKEEDREQTDYLFMNRS